ncbi:MCE family protein [Mycobacterium sp. NPDC051198]
MRMNRRIWIQLAVLTVVTLTAFTVMALGYMRLPNLLFGVGHYRVTVQLPEAAGLYGRANVTYLGTEVGQVRSVELTDTGVDAVLSLRSDVDIPSDLDAEVHSTSAVGEQYVALLPRAGQSAPLADGDVIPVERTTVPPDVNTLLDATNTGLQAIPGDNLKTVIDESYLAFGGLGPELSRIVKGSTRLASDSRAHLDDLTNVIDNVGPILDTQTDTADSVRAWAANLAGVTQQLKDNDTAVRGVLQRGPAVADEVRQLFDRIQPTLPIVLANMSAIAPVLATYNASLEQILVLLPVGTAAMQAITVANRDMPPKYRGAYMSFNLNFNLPPPCTTGFLPIQQQRQAVYEDYADRPAGDVYCRVPQDSMFNVRGAKNYPCITRPGKRAPTVKQCESDEQYVPLNDGFNWKGDPNATLSGQDIPHIPPEPAGQAPAPPPVAIAEYDPATGTYFGPDGNMYTQADLARTAPKEQTWQSMLTPPTQ